MLQDLQIQICRELYRTKFAALFPPVRLEITPLNNFPQIIKTISHHWYQHQAFPCKSKISQIKAILGYSNDEEKNQRLDTAITTYKVDEAHDWSSEDDHLTRIRIYNYEKHSDRGLSTILDDLSTESLQDVDLCFFCMREPSERTIVWQDFDVDDPELALRYWIYSCGDNPENRMENLIRRRLLVNDKKHVLRMLTESKIVDIDNILYNYGAQKIPLNWLPKHLRDDPEIQSKAAPSDGENWDDLYDE